MTANKVVALKLFTNDAFERARRMPTQFSSHEAELLLRWAMRIGLSAEQLRYAIRSVRDWAETRCRAPLKRDWVRTVQTAVRRGWALEGFEREAHATSKGAINPRTGQKIIKRTPITEPYIAAYLAWLKTKGDA